MIVYGRRFRLAQQLLEVADLCDTQHPDERSVMTYIAGFFHAFSSMGADNQFSEFPRRLLSLFIRANRDRL